MRTYLGDSVYAEYDGVNLTVYLDNGAGPKSIIVMEPSVLSNLIAFIDQGPDSNGTPDLPVS